MNVLNRLGLLLLMPLGTGGCLLSEDVCTPADTTYSCCVKQHLGSPSSCGASEAEANALKQGASQNASGTQGTAVAVGTVTAAATLSSDGEIFSRKLRAAVEKVLSECAVQANEAVNRRRLGGDPTWEQCEEVLKWEANGKPITRAMKLGEEKHAEAIQCAAERLGKMLPERFSLEQRYRHDPETGRLALVSSEQHQELMRTKQENKLRGTLVPDVVIHAKGNPLKTQFVYDFKFPCPKSNRPKWKVYPKESLYRDQTQGNIYEKFLGPALRVTPWEII